MAKIGGEVHKCQNEAYIKTIKYPWQQLSRGGIRIVSNHVYAAVTKALSTLPCKTEETWWKGSARAQ